MNQGYSQYSRGQRGAALLVVLIMLIVVTLLGLASMRGVLMQERMAANTAARSVAFQAAESGLRQAEILARDANIVIAPKADPADPQTCAGGRCTNPGTTVPLWQSNVNFWKDGQSGYQTGSTIGSGNSAVTPKFIVEDMGQAEVRATTSSGSGSSIDASIPPPSSSGARQSVYRITSYASTRTGAEVILQSMYRR